MYVCIYLKTNIHFLLSIYVFAYYWLTKILIIFYVFCLFIFLILSISKEASLFKCFFVVILMFTLINIFICFFFILLHHVVCWLVHVLPASSERPWPFSSSNGCPQTRSFSPTILRRRICSTQSPPPRCEFYLTPIKWPKL